MSKKDLKQKEFQLLHIFRVSASSTYGRQIKGYQLTVNCKKNPQLQNAKCNKDIRSFSPTPINK
jgi:hypothetical protein